MSFWVGNKARPSRIFRKEESQLVNIHSGDKISLSKNCVDEIFSYENRKVKLY